MLRAMQDPAEGKVEEKLGGEFKLTPTTKALKKETEGGDERHQESHVRHRCCRTAKRDVVDEKKGDQGLWQVVALKRRDLSVKCPAQRKQKADAIAPKGNSPRGRQIAKGEKGPP